MKNLITIIFAVFVLISCKTNKIEVLPDYDAEYYSAALLDKQPEIKGNEEEVQNKILEIVEDAAGKNENETLYFFNAKLYINSAGKIERIQYQAKKGRTSNKEALINPNIHELFKELTSYFESVTFSPGEINSESKASRILFDGSFRVVNSKAEYILDLNIGEIFKGKAFNKSIYFVAVEEMPEPVGGIKAIQSKITYPEIAKRAGIQGRVFVKAYIDENGDVNETEIIKGIGAGCDEAAMRAVEQTKFTPGKQRGKPVKVQVSVPILFKLSDSPEPKKDSEKKFFNSDKSQKK